MTGRRGTLLRSKGKHRLPSSIKPMQARSQRRPFDSVDHIFEPRDGIRVLTFVDSGNLRLQTRNLNDVTARFPELAPLPEQLTADGVILDGEIVCLDDDGRPSFSQMQRRFQRTPASSQDPLPRVTFIPFDILYIENTSVMDRPLMERKAMLSDHLEPTDDIRPCDYVEDDGVAFFEAAQTVGLEGMVAKVKSSQYHPGPASLGLSDRESRPLGVEL